MALVPKSPYSTLLHKCWLPFLPGPPHNQSPHRPEKHRWTLQLSVGQGSGYQVDTGEEAEHSIQMAEAARGAACPGRSLTGEAAHRCAPLPAVHTQVLTAPTQGALDTSAFMGPFQHLKKKIKNHTFQLHQYINECIYMCMLTVFPST